MVIKMQYTIVTENSLDKNKLIVTHIKTDDLKSAFKSIGKNPKKAIVFKGKHYPIIESMR